MKEEMMIKKIIFGLFLMTGMILLSACQPKDEMGMTAVMPIGAAYAEGEKIYFMHTETSDAGVADLLTKMMDSPVLLVPALSDTPDIALANVYVFTNGITGGGPLGFAPDVFDNPPGSENYTPLRRLVMVTWAGDTAARELKSSSEIMEASAAGEVSLETTTVVINMPFVVWDGGKR